MTVCNVKGVAWVDPSLGPCIKTEENSLDMEHIQSFFYQQF